MLGRWLLSLVPAPAAKGSDSRWKTTGTDLARFTAASSVASWSVTMTLTLSSTAASMRLGSVARSPCALETLSS